MNYVDLFLSRFTGKSYKTMHQGMRALSRHLSGDLSCDDPRDVAWDRVGYSHLLMLRNKLVLNYKASSVNFYLAVLKSFVKEVWRAGGMVTDEYIRIRDIPKVRCSGNVRGRDVAEGDLGELFGHLMDVPEDKPSIRDVAILSVFCSTGMRVFELVNLMVEDIDAVNSTLKVKRTKGNQERSCCIIPKTSEFLSNWLRIRGLTSGFLFNAIDKGGKVNVKKGVSTRAIQQILSRRTTESGITAFSPHDLRRTFVGDMLDNHDIRTVQRVVGHSNIAMTARYDRRGQEVIRRAMEGFRLPIGE